MSALRPCGPIWAQAFGGPGVTRLSAHSLPFPWSPGPQLLSPPLVLTMGKGRGQTQVSKRTFGTRSAEHSPGNLHGPSQHPPAPLMVAAPGLGTPWPGGLSSLEGVQDSVLWGPQGPALFCLPCACWARGPWDGCGVGVPGDCLPAAASNLRANSVLLPSAVLSQFRGTSGR